MTKLLYFKDKKLIGVTDKEPLVESDRHSTTEIKITVVGADKVMETTQTVGKDFSKVTLVEDKIVVKN
jgi:hypothetical protein